MAVITVGRTIGYGALAGAVAGGAGAAVQYWLVEPSIRAAIAIEDTRSATDHADHGHMSDVVVSRGEQVGFGLLAVLIVGTLIGIAFALVRRFLGDRVPGRSASGSAIALAGLGFAAFTLAPALVIPANPPAVGDPATVDARTVTYLGTIFCAVVLTSAVTSLARAKRLEPGLRVVAATALAIAGSITLFWVIPDVADPIPSDVPAQLIWNFRVGSLVQIGLMWLIMGGVFGYLSEALARARSGVGARSSAQFASR
ncbi:CbtA family protein [Streptomyces sp. NPDC057474]|uniref:CbtA family protein n=1 Tax=Streptomyces sp. NPDC057474 TaxID=3346144 RepID=UPI0036AC382F